MTKFDARNWDEQFENDACSSKLDAISDRAISDFQKGKCRELCKLSPHM